MSLFTINVKDALYNAGYNLSLVPFEIAVVSKCGIDAVLPAKKTKEEKEAKKEEKKAAKAEKKEAKAEKKEQKKSEKATKKEDKEVKAEEKKAETSEVKSEAKKEVKVEETKVETTKTESEVDDKTLAEKVHESIDNRKEMKNAVKDFPYKISKEMEEQIDSKSDNALVRVNMIAKNEAAIRLVSYAMYYMTNNNATLVTNFKEEEKRIINAVTEMFGFGKIYEDEFSADLYAYDMNSVLYNKSDKYLLNVEKDVTFRMHDRLIMDMITARKVQLGKNIIEGECKEVSSVTEAAPEVPKEEVKVEEVQEVIRPVSFENLIIKDGEQKEAKFDLVKEEKEPVAQEEYIVPEFRIPDEMKTELDNVLGEFLKDKNYSYVMKDDIIHLKIRRDNKIDEYIIDNKHVLGGSTVSVAVNVGQEIIFVPTKWKQIVQNILESKLYVPTNAEVEKIRLDYFDDETIYQVVDMNNTAFIDTLKPEDKSLLESKLSFISELTRKKYPETSGVRLRFDKFTDVNEFELVSDQDAWCPLCRVGLTCGFHMNGKLRYKVVKDTVFEVIDNVSTMHNLGTITN